MAKSLPAIGKANEPLFAVVGEAKAAAFSTCRDSYTPCTIDTHHAKNISALCCAADAEKGWSLPGPAAAVGAALAAGKTVSGGGTVWWVNVNQTLKTGAAPFVNRLAIQHQYVNWFPTACNNATAIGMFQNMMCHGGSILECRLTHTLRECACGRLPMSAALVSTGRAYARPTRLQLQTLQLVFC